MAAATAVNLQREPEKTADYSTSDTLGGRPCARSTANALQFPRKHESMPRAGSEVRMYEHNTLSAAREGPNGKIKWDTVIG